MQAVHYTLYLRVFVLRTHQNEVTPTEWAFVWLCVRAVAALQCEVCTQRTAACDCQSYDSCRISWSSSTVTLPSLSQFGFISQLRSCAAMLPSPPPQTKPLILIIFDLKVSCQVRGYHYVPHSGLCALLVSHVDPKLVEQQKKKKEKKIMWYHHVMSDKQKKRLLHQKTFADFATPESSFEYIYLHIWQESWEERWNLKGEKSADDKWEQKQSGGRRRQREWRRESDTTIMWGPKNAASTRPVSWFYYYLR